MTTPQIIIISIIFLIDILRTIFLVRNGNEKLNNWFWDFVRIMMVYVIMTVICLENNRLSSKTPCPKLEKIENAYQIK